VIHRASTSTNKAIGGLLTAVLASGAYAGAALAAAPDADATCVSAFGIGNSTCQSTLTSVAIAIGGPTTVAHADGNFAISIAIGNDSLSDTYPGSFFNFTMAIGNNTLAEAYDLASAAVAVGNNSSAVAAPLLPFRQIGNVAINLANHSNPDQASAVGIGNIAVNVGGDFAPVAAGGIWNTAVNILGSGRFAAGTAGNTAAPAFPYFANLAFNILGRDNEVSAVPGTFAIAGSIFQRHSAAIMDGPGININGLAVGGVAARTSTATATALQSKKATTAEPAATARTSKAIAASLQTKKATTAKPAAAAGKHSKRARAVGASRTQPSRG
jgi:hypothetical protein